MTKLHDFAFKELYDKIFIIDKRIKDHKIEKAKLIKDAGIIKSAYNYRVRTKKF
jgi:hypothetical protein